jgi:hypothetical protein
MLLQPVEPNYHITLAGVSYREQEYLGVVLDSEAHMCDVRDTPSLIWGAIHIVNWNRYS